MIIATSTSATSISAIPKLNFPHFCWMNIAQLAPDEKDTRDFKILKVLGG